MKYYALKISGIILFIFILQLFFPVITESFKLVSADAFERPWILVTAIFLHGSIAHLLYNLLGLALFGTILEGTIGERNFLLVFFISGLFASLTVIPFYSSALGASGAIFGIIGMLAVLRPSMTVWVSYIPMPMFMAAMFWAVGDIFGLFMPSDIANAAHLGGLFIGVAAGFMLRKKYALSIEEKRTALNIPKKEWEEWEEKYMLKEKKSK